MWLYWKTALANFRGPRPTQSAVQPAPEPVTQPAPQPPQPGVAQFFQTNQGAFAAVASAVGTCGLAYQVAYQITNHAAELKIKVEVEAIRHSAEIDRVRADASIQAAQQSAAIDRVRAEQAKSLLDNVFHADYQAFRDNLQKDAEKKKDAGVKTDVKTDVDVDADKKEP